MFSDHSLRNENEQSQYHQVFHQQSIYNRIIQIKALLTMSIEQLTTIQQQFSRHLQTIREESRNLPKSQILRIGAWLKKLCSVVDNYFWRKNRNLYTQVLALMLVQGNLQAPFDKAPPQGSLPKLTTYQIPFSIRQKLEGNRSRHQEKQNNLELANLSLNRINSFDVSNLRCKKRQSFALKSLKSISDNQLDCQNVQVLKTKRKKVKNQPKNKKLLETISSILHFLAKNKKQFEDDRDYVSFIREIVEFGDITGQQMSK